MEKQINSIDIKKAQYLRISLQEQIKENDYKKGTIGDAINQALLKVLKHSDDFLIMFASMVEFETEEINKHLKKAFEYAEIKSKADADAQSDADADAQSDADADALFNELEQKQADARRTADADADADGRRQADADADATPDATPKTKTIKCFNCGAENTIRF